MQILLTNDDGVYAPGIAALRSGLTELGNVNLVAPATEQSGVGHSITFLEPLVCKEIYNGDELFGIAVEGSPADSVKLGVSELLPGPIDAVVSGINGGLNAGINVLYSGTVAASIEGAFFRINSFAVSLEYDPHADFDTAAVIAVGLIRQILEQKSVEPQLFNINIPTAAVERFRDGQDVQVHVVPMGVERYGEHYIKRQDPKGRNYYWATNDPPPQRTDHPTDLTMLADGHVTVTPLMFDLTSNGLLGEMAEWTLKVER
ncbi:MAG TPA: 5'/3'-nucleotidase SurE [Planctomycetaceae bacterium]|nr:5'/3'-nucleotidase SurE [Planctomycetaceae bacterium]